MRYTFKILTALISISIYILPSTKCFKLHSNICDDPKETSLKADLTKSKSYDIFNYYGVCNYMLDQGLCEASFAVSVSKLVSMQKCVDNNGILKDGVIKYSPQSLINCVDYDTPCKKMSDISILEKF